MNQDDKKQGGKPSAEEPRSGGEAARVGKKLSQKGAARRQKQPPQRRFLDGQMLVAMPGMLDSRFARSVIYLCAHSEDGAMGIVVNQPAQIRNFPDLLVQLQVIAPEERISLPRATKEIQVLQGGPVQTDRGFVLHSADFFIDNSTLPIDDGVSLTATIDILRAIAVGEGPNQAILALGYAGWEAGQLETEIQHNGWLNCPADPALLFDRDLESKYTRALRSMGIDLARLSSGAGHG
jgi:putative transcriptional regulator